MKRPFEWVVLVHGGQAEPLACAPDLDQLARDLETRYDRRYGAWRIAVEERALFREGELKTIHWIRVRLEDQGPPLGCLDVALEIRNSGTGIQRISHVLFTPARYRAGGEDWREWNGRVAQWWKSGWSSQEAKQWADAAHRVMTSVMTGAVHVSQARQDSGF